CPQEQCITFDRVLGSDAAQEAEEVQHTLGSVGRGYNVALLLRGWETEAPLLVPQLLQMLFEEALPLGSSDPVLSTRNLVQLRPWRKARPGEPGWRAVGRAWVDPFCCSPAWAYLSGVSFFLPETAAFWRLAWPTELQHEEHVS
ncbi:hypothetical protein MDA_GLEAN10012433, partial [Myotis davidii]